MGLATVLCCKRLGWFIPYRYADTVSDPDGYPALEPFFKAAEPNFENFLNKFLEITSFFTQHFVKKWRRLSFVLCIGHIGKYLKRGTIDFLHNFVNELRR